MNILGQRIKLLRKEKMLTQEEFGEIFGVAKSTVSLYEAGKSTPDDTIKINICKYFGVSMDYLLGLSDIRNPYTPKVLAAHSSSNQFSEEDLDDIQRILSIIEKQKNK